MKTRKGDPLLSCLKQFSVFRGTHAYLLHIRIKKKLLKEAYIVDFFLYFIYDNKIRGNY